MPGARTLTYIYVCKSMYKKIKENQQQAILLRFQGSGPLSATHLNFKFNSYFSRCARTPLCSIQIKCYEKCKRSTRVGRRLSISVICEHKCGK